MCGEGYRGGKKDFLFYFFNGEKENSEFYLIFQFSQKERARPKSAAFLGDSPVGFRGGDLIYFVMSILTLGILINDPIKDI